MTGEQADFIKIYNLDNNEQIRKKVNEKMLGDTKGKIISDANIIRQNKLEKKCSKEKCADCYMMHFLDILLRNISSCSNIHFIRV